MIWTKSGATVIKRTLAIQNANNLSLRMLSSLDLATLSSTDHDGAKDLRGLFRTGRRILKRCWLDRDVIFQNRIFCQNSGACGSTYIVKLLKENGVEKVFHEKTPDLNGIGIQHYEQRLPMQRIVRLLRYTRHDAYFEANNRLFSLSKEIGFAFPSVTFIHLHRDGSEAVRSALSRPGINQYLCANIRFQGTLAGPRRDEPFIRFCHYWANMNRRIAEDLDVVSRVYGQTSITLRFEDLVEGRVASLEDVLGRTLSKRTVPPANVGHVRPSGKFPGYPEWSVEQKSAFDRICGPVMSMLGR